jgi:hypothetical protein
MARLHRVRIGISSFIGSCFSTTRSLTFLAFAITIAIGVVAAAGIGTLAVTWMAMEEPPSSLYQTLTISPSRSITDAKRNGYLLLLGFDAPDGQDPVQVGYERKPQRERDQVLAQVCLGEEARTPGGTGGASDHMVKGWIRSGDFIAGIKGQGGTLKSLTSREATALARYQQWLTMSFDDWGFGQPFSPNCTQVLFAHRLYVLDGFSQDLSSGLDRLEADVQAWRGALGQAKSRCFGGLRTAEPCGTRRAVAREAEQNDPSAGSDGALHTVADAESVCVGDQNGFGRAQRRRA